MDARGQIGPEKDNYDADVMALAVAIQSGAIVRVKLAERMTRYDLVLCLTSVMTSTCQNASDEHDLFVAHIGRGALLLPSQGGMHPSYLNEKMPYEAGGDGEIVAAFLNRLGAALTLIGATA